MWGQRREPIDEAQLILDLCETMRHGSLCALGGFTPFPVLSAMRYFPEDFGLAPGWEAMLEPAESGA